MYFNQEKIVKRQMDNHDQYLRALNIKNTQGTGLGTARGGAGYECEIVVKPNGYSG